MRFLLRIINRFFVFLGVIFLIFIVVLIYLFVADPFELKPILKMINLDVISKNLKSSDQSATSTETNIDKNPLLNSEQENNLSSFGIDPSALPKEITPEMEKCFRDNLGNEKVDQIIKSGQPDMSDFFKARSCL